MVGAGGLEPPTLALQGQAIKVTSTTYLVDSGRKRAKQRVGAQREHALSCDI
jgi:hypothetical protein